MRFVAPETFRKLHTCAKSFVNQLTTPDLKEWFFVIARDWQNIVGHELAQQTVPQGLWFRAPKEQKQGFLTVRVTSQGAALVLQHELSFMRDAVNKYYGSPLIKTIKLVAR